VYGKMGECPKALLYYEEDLEICEKTIPPNHPNLVAVHNNIDFVYQNTDEYSIAFSYYEKALEIHQ
jgi:tetratricopeptide (TPR) repeat protein